jgi:hypothetical protein
MSSINVLFPHPGRAANNTGRLGCILLGLNFSNIMVRDAGLALLLLVGGGGNGAGALNMVNNEARDLMNDATSALQNYWWVAGWSLFKEPFLSHLLYLSGIQRPFGLIRSDLGRQSNGALATVKMNS